MGCRISELKKTVLVNITFILLNWQAAKEIINRTDGMEFALKMNASSTRSLRGPFNTVLFNFGSI